MEKLMQRKLAGETGVLSEKKVALLFFSPQIPHDLIWDRTLAVAVCSLSYCMALVGFPPNKLTLLEQVSR
jgi:hypothetical protein